MASKKKDEERSSKADAARERKDRLLQTRITPSLHHKVVERAEALKIPVSNLVRIILEDSIKLVDGVVDEGLSIAQILSASGGAPARKPRPSAAPAPTAVPAAATEEQPSVWQTVVIGRRAVCGDCGRALYPAEDAHMGLGTDGRPLLFACPDCYTATLERARSESE